MARYYSGFFDKDDAFTWEVFLFLLATSGGFLEEAKAEEVGRLHKNEKKSQFN